MTDPSDATKQPESSETPKAPLLAGKISSFSQRPLISDEMWELGAQHLREDLSCEPFYANRAAAEKARSGDEMVYWRGLATLGPALNRRPKEFSTVKIGGTLYMVPIKADPTSPST